MLYDDKVGTTDPNVPLTEQVTPADMNAIKAAIQQLQTDLTTAQASLGQIAGSYMSKINYDPTNTGSKVATALLAEALVGFDAAEVDWYPTKNASDQLIWKALPVSNVGGTQLFVGESIPDAGLGTDGDIYIQASTPLQSGQPIWFIKQGVDWSAGVSFAGQDGAMGAQGPQGADGESAYEIWIAEGNAGTEQDFLDSLQGEKGDPGSYGVVEGINLAAFIDFANNGEQHGDIYSPLTDTKYIINVPNPEDLGSIILWINTASKPEFVSDQDVLLIGMGAFLNDWKANTTQKIVLTLKKVDQEFHLLASLDDKGKVYTSMGSGASARQYEDIDDWTLSANSEIIGRGSSIRTSGVSVDGSYEISAQDNDTISIDDRLSLIVGVPVQPNDRFTVALGHASDPAASDGQYTFQYIGGWYFRHKTESGLGTGPYAFTHGTDEFFIDILDTGATPTIEIGKWEGGKGGTRTVLRTINETDRLDNLFLKTGQRQNVTNEISNARKAIY